MLRGWRTRLRRLNSSEESTMRPSADSKARRRRQWRWLRNYSLARRAASCESNTSALSSWSSECKVRNLRERVGREQGAGREQLRKPTAVPRAAIREAGVEAVGRGGPSRVLREAGEQAEGEQPHLPPAAADPPLKVKRREALHEDLLLCEERQEKPIHSARARHQYAAAAVSHHRLPAAPQGRSKMIINFYSSLKYLHWKFVLTGFN